MTLAQQPTAVAANTQCAKRKQGHNYALTDRRGRCAARGRRVKHAASEILVIKLTQHTEMMMHDTGATTAAAAASTRRSKREQGHNWALTRGRMKALGFRLKPQSILRKVQASAPSVCAPGESRPARVGLPRQK